MAPVVELRRLTKRFGRTTALASIDLELGGNEIVGVVGPDGAGKTTLIRTLAGLLEIEAERATVLGFDLLADDVTELKRHVGYVPQSFSLVRDLSVLENLKFTARLHRLPTQLFEARVTKLLARTGLAPFQERTAGALSGGMKQKLAVANALLPEPSLLLLDEPTAGVDVSARAAIWSMLEDTRQRALVVMSTSYLDEADACDRLLYLDDGKLIAAGTPDGLKHSLPLELYRAWCEHPRALAHAARDLPYVESTRPLTAFTRIDVARDRSPGLAQIRTDLDARADGAIFLVEQLPTDMESTLTHLARAGHVS